MANPLQQAQERSMYVVSQDPFAQTQYLVRKKMFSLLGHHFHIFDAQGNLVSYSHMKGFRLKEDIRIYSGEDKREELLVIKARSIIDFGATYDVTDSRTRQKVGALRRKGFKSILRDEWIILDANDQELGFIQEDNWAMALIRRFACDVPFFGNIIPQNFNLTVDANPVAEFKQNFNPFVLKLNLDFSPDRAGSLDRRLGIAASILLCAIEGRQQ